MSSEVRHLHVIMEIPLNSLGVTTYFWDNSYYGFSEGKRLSQQVGQPLLFQLMNGLQQLINWGYFPIADIAQRWIK